MTELVAFKHSVLSLDGLLHKHISKNARAEDVSKATMKARRQLDLVFGP